MVNYAVFAGNLAGGTQYCDCTNIYKASLPNGSHCAADTTFNTWTLNCDPKVSTGQREFPVIAAIVQTVKLQSSDLKTDRIGHGPNLEGRGC